MNIVLALDSDNNADILFKDATGILQSAKSNSKAVEIIGVGEHTISIIVIYNDSVNELYTFDTMNNKMFYSIHRFEVAINKSATLVGNCEYR
ncbi:MULTISPECIES: hypothetical protein [unclassified Iodidimonas]|uniref:hypothetical protein n=1 Tax=unclassified Iodidimonas TaxID=2626145 RepID=UPI002482C9D3|nr:MULTISPECIES: hypothetical protein [unclassified Iodidimonas]